MDLMNNVQVRGMLDRLLIMGFTWLAAKGYISTADVANFVTAGGAIAVAIYGVWINRSSNLASKAAQVPGTTVITTPEIAAATPNQANIVSSTENKVVSK